MYWEKYFHVTTHTLKTHSVFEPLDFLQKLSKDKSYLKITLKSILSMPRKRSGKKIKVPSKYCYETLLLYWLL